MRREWVSGEDGRDEKDYQPDMPPLDDGRLVEFAFEIGPTIAAGMGAGPITHGEIQSWQLNTGIRLSGWESRALRRLSIVYINEQHRAEKLGCEPPWKPEGEDFKREPTALQISLRALIEDK